ncbi:hypothetical protein [uncultured Campylobacter sp.]|uniref:hypothetical protein n=1 Tax=uncultured Campylobacter sp. TaxID=218934 RepID=UPI0026353565|nr:hypothetical protein [uncultured Campylobacter sp.]
MRHKIAPSKKRKFNKHFNGDGVNFKRELYVQRKERKFNGRGVAASAKYKHSRNMKF